jgi:hypothetical protein
MLTGVKSLTDAIEQALGRLDIERVRREYWSQNEFIVLKEALPRDLMEEHFTPAAQRLKPLLNRNYIPKHKKGGSVSYFTVREQAPEFIQLYGSPAFMAFLTRLVGMLLMPCPAHDPHACALYYYTEPGDHIGFHYDTSYYKGTRYTILLGILDKSEQCKLVAHLYKDDPGRETKSLELKTEPGDMVIFNGDKLWHAVTPLGEGEERIVLTMEYVTNQEMGTFKRLYSNLKDAFGYFGLRAVWGTAR